MAANGESKKMCKEAVGV